MHFQVHYKMPLICFGYSLKFLMNKICNEHNCKLLYTTRIHVTCTLNEVEVKYTSG